MVFVLLAVLPDALRKRNFLYTASQIEIPAPKNLDMATSFPRIGKTSVEGQTTLAKLAAGNPGGLIVCFWATWCPPCLEELPSLENLHRQLSAKGDPNLPKLVTISVDDSPAVVTAFYKTLSTPLSFPVLHDKDGAFAKQAGTNRFPETYWISSDGVVKHKWLGPQNWLSDAVQRRLASP